MRWYRNLYLGPRTVQKIQKIREKAALGSLMAGVYYITPSSVEGNLLDIFHNGMLQQPVFSDVQCTDVIGVAEGRQEAFRLTAGIIQDVYRRTGGFDIRSYFKSEDFTED